MQEIENENGSSKMTVQPIKFAKVVSIFISIVILVFIGGTAFDSLLLSRQKLVSDVGAEGAWVISAIYHLIYGVFIAVGVTASILVKERLFNKAILLKITLASVLSVLIFDLILLIPVVAKIHFFILMAVLSGISFSLGVVLSGIFIKRFE